MKTFNFLLASMAMLTMTIIPLAACSGSTNNGIEIEDAWIRAATAQMMIEGQGTDQPDMSGSGHMENIGGSNSAAYMIIHNTNSEPDRLLSVHSEVARSTEIHLSEEKNGVMRMRPVEGIDIPARGIVELKPGGYHCMLVGISRNLTPGSKVSLTLEFQNAGKIQVPAEVRAP